VGGTGTEVAKTAVSPPRNDARGGEGGQRARQTEESEAANAVAAVSLSPGPRAPAQVRLSFSPALFGVRLIPLRRWPSPRLPPPSSSRGPWARPRAPFPRVPRHHSDARQHLRRYVAARRGASLSRPALLPLLLVLLFKVL